MADLVSGGRGAKTIETFQGWEIVFSGDAWVNATHMAAAFGTSPAQFLRTDGAQAFIAALEKTTMQKCILVQNGGIAPGTWMHPDLALEFARWLSPDLAIWTNQVSRRVLNGGQATTDNATVLNLMGRMLERIEKLEGKQPSAVAPVALPRMHPLKADHVIEIRHSYPSLPPVPTSEVLVARFLANVLDFRHTLCDELVVSPHTLTDLARRNGNFTEWLGRRGGSHAVAKFMSRLHAYFGRPLRTTPEAAHAYSLTPSVGGSRNHRTYVIAKRAIQPGETTSFERAAQALLLVERALDTGSEVVVK